jgi:hypothetical protein
VTAVAAAAVLAAAARDIMDMMMDRYKLQKELALSLLYGPGTQSRGHLSGDTASIVLGTPKSNDEFRMMMMMMMMMMMTKIFPDLCVDVFMVVVQKSKIQKCQQSLWNSKCLSFESSTRARNFVDPALPSKDTVQFESNASDSNAEDRRARAKYTKHEIFTPRKKSYCGLLTRTQKKFDCKATSKPSNQVSPFSFISFF